MTPVLELFCPPVREWFTSQMGAPTEIQELAWPRIAAGEHVLVSAPTGSGKTLTAFLWALHQLASGQWEEGRLRVLYVSPLKALGNDIRRNLLLPLSELPGFFGTHTMPQIRVATRTGDTPQTERQRMLRSPPEILITTPESLNILLTSAGGRNLLRHLETIILDEVHAVIGSKRGVHLITAVERLVPLCGELQRIALSATVRPRARVARWVGGYASASGDPQAEPSPRAVTVLSATQSKAMDLQVRLPTAGPELAEGSRDAVWAGLTGQLRGTIRRNRSTLVFGNSRRMVEKVARLINEREAEQLAYSHHGSLSREIRTVVEERLKAGELKAIVATNSLELGIDIGSIDEVAMVQAPPSVASTVQRVGRSGHGVGETSRGRIYPMHKHGLVDCAVVARAAVEGEIEPVHPICGALDVLAQVVLSMTVAETWHVDELFAAVRCSDPYRHLPRRHFDLVLEMLAGRYATTRIRSLRPLVSLDGIDGTIRARPGAERLVYLSGGTIADRGYYQLRLQGVGSAIGELDEEFVWERSVGDTFSLGVQSWRVQGISHNDVFVTPAPAASAMAPFWRAEERNRSYFLSEKLGEFLEWCAARLDDDTLIDDLETLHHMDVDAAKDLRLLLEEQQAATRTLPHRHQVVEEHCASSRGRGSERQIILHTLWGGRVNRPLAAALATAWERRHGRAPGIAQDDDCIIISFPSTLDVADPLALVKPEAVDELLHARLATSGFFGARFREAAGCALMLPRAGFRKRTPLWLHRQRAKELLEAVSGHDDFPLTLEAWRSCLQDDFEIDRLKELLADVREGRIAVQRVLTDSPSPFAAQVLWKQTNELMYEDDTPLAKRGAGVRKDLLREVALSSALRPMIPAAIARGLERRLQRTEAGYAPRSPRDLLDWVVERIAVPTNEWQRLLDAAQRDHGFKAEELLEGTADRLLGVAPKGGTQARFVCAVEVTPRLFKALGMDPVGLRFFDPRSWDQAPEGAVAALHSLLARQAQESDAHEWNLVDLLSEWLRFCGPITTAAIAAALPVEPSTLEEALAELADEQVVVVDRITADAETDQVCDRENLERLLRLVRSESRPSLAPVSVDHLPLLLACQQGLGEEKGSPEELKTALEALFGVPARAELWEGEILPARVEPYLSPWLDTLVSETDLRWLGCGLRRLIFSFDGDRELFAEASTNEEAAPELFPQPYGRYPFHELVRHFGSDSATVTATLWEEVWQGRVSADSFAPVRRGVASRFAAPEGEQHAVSSRARRRPRFDRWASGRPFSGNWFALSPVAPPRDALDEEEKAKDRARVLLDRYGILFRSLLERELPPLHWSRVFRALRLLELSGEIVAGSFIAAVPGLQFASHTALRRLQQGLPEDRIWWLNAADPASPCGLGLDGLDPDLPTRSASNHLVFHGRRLVVVSEARAARLRIRTCADDPRLAEYLHFLKVLLTRAVQPHKSLTVETVNGEPAATGEFRKPLAELFQVTRTRTGLRLAKRY